MPRSINGKEHITSRENSGYLPRMNQKSPELTACDRGADTGPLLLSCPHSVLVMEETGLSSLLRSVPCQGRAVQAGELLVPYNCPRRVKTLHPIPPPELREDSPCPTAPAWPGDPDVGTAAGVLSCRRAGCGRRHRHRHRAAGERQPRPSPRSPGQLPGLFVSCCAHLLAQPVSGFQPCSGKEREKWCFAGGHGTVQPCWSLGQMSLCLWEKPQPGARQPFPSLNRAWLSDERKGQRCHWKRAKRMSRRVVPNSCWDRRVKRAPVLLESCGDTARDGQPRTLPSHPAVPTAGLPHAPRMPQCKISCL